MQTQRINNIGIGRKGERLVRHDRECDSKMEADGIDKQRGGTKISNVDHSIERGSAPKRGNDNPRFSCGQCKPWRAILHWRTGWNDLGIRSTNKTIPAM